MSKESSERLEWVSGEGWYADWHSIISPEEEEDLLKKTTVGIGWTEDGFQVFVERATGKRRYFSIPLSDELVDQLYEVLRQSYEKKP